MNSKVHIDYYFSEGGLRGGAAFEERRQGRRRGSLKGYATDATQGQARRPVPHLEHDSSRQLHRTRFVGLRRNQAEGRVGGRQLGKRERRVVEQVEGLEAKLKVALPAVREIHLFQHRRVDFVEAVAAQAREGGGESAAVISELIVAPGVESAGIERQAIRFARVEIQFVAEIHQVADRSGTGSHPRSEERRVGKEGR